MTFISHNGKPINQEEEPRFHSAQDVDKALEKIDHILHQMLLLAELSASDNFIVDREALQKIFEGLQDKLDYIADNL